MLIFCPSCANVLITSRIPSGPNANRNRFECRTCPFQYIIDKRYYERKDLKGKEVEDIIGGKDAWKNADRTGVQCVNAGGGCTGTEAYFYQLQIRSADEPMTSFFKCVVCGREWRE